MTPTTRTYPRTLYGSQGAFRNAPEYASAIHRPSEREWKWVDRSIAVLAVLVIGAFVIERILRI